MPRQRITKQVILNAAFELTREQGFEQVNARNVAKKAGCSVQPIYSYFSNMQDLMDNLFVCAQEYLNQYIDAHADKQNYFASIGHCHISFAMEEKSLFRFLFLSPYVRANGIEGIYQKYEINDVTQFIQAKFGFNESAAKELYLSMMIYTHGIACMLATDAAHISFDEIHPKVDFAFRSFLSQIKKEYL